MSGDEFNGLDRNLTCILFPGIVKNDDKAIECLGGIKAISQVYSQPTKKRLGLSFQPENPYVKKVYADTKKSSGVLLKVKVKKRKTEGGEIKREVVSTDVVGKVTITYRFESMCDFQYLPISLNEGTGKMECILENIIPSGKESISYLVEPSKLFIVPSHFTRSDKPIPYTYTDKRYPDRSGSPQNDDYHKRCRSERSLPLGHWWTFNFTDDFPSEPLPFYIKNRDSKYELNSCLKKDFEVVEKCFQERPVWSLNLIRFHTKIRVAHLKILVPCLAVLMKDGPWKKMWVRYGYDPRKDVGARMYQTLDFRLRHTAGIYATIMTRDQITHYKKAGRVRQLKRKNRDMPLPSEEICEGACYFRPGLVPAQRQIFYQMIDVKIPEVQRILEEIPPPDRECHEKHGWLLPNTIEYCREQIFKYVTETILSSNQTNFKLDVAMSSEDDDNSDENEPDVEESMANEMVDTT